MYNPELFEEISYVFSDIRCKCLKEEGYNKYKAGHAVGNEMKQYYLAKALANRVIYNSIDDWRNELIYKLMKEDEKNV